MVDLYAELEDMILHYKYGVDIWIGDHEDILFRRHPRRTDFYDCTYHVYFKDSSDVVVLYELAEKYQFNLSLAKGTCVFEYNKETKTTPDKNSVLRRLEANINYLLNEDSKYCADYLWEMNRRILPVKYFSWYDICRLMRDYQREHNVYSIRVD